MRLPSGSRPPDTRGDRGSSSSILLVRTAASRVSGRTPACRRVRRRTDPVRTRTRGGSPRRRPAPSEAGVERACPDRNRRTGSQGQYSSKTPCAFIRYEKDATQSMTAVRAWQAGRHDGSMTFVDEFRRIVPLPCGGRVAVAEALARLVDVAMEHEQPIGVAVGIGEVVALAAARGHTQILLQIVDLKRAHVQQCHTEGIVLVRGLVAQTLRRRDETALA